MSTSNKDIVAYIELLDWSVAFNGEHFTATARCGEEVLNDIKHKLTTGAAGRMNKKDGSRLNRPGDLSCRFETEGSAIRESINQIRLHWPNVKIIIRGNNAYCDPQCVVWADHVEDMNVLNEIYEEYGEYQEETILDNICKEWDETIKWIDRRSKK